MQGTLLQILPKHFHSWVSLLTNHWILMRRWITYSRHVHPIPICATNGLPQGDPAAPVLMLTLLRAGMLRVSRVLPDASFQCIYVDDRTIVANHPCYIQLAQDVWAQFADQYHLRENADKAHMLDLSVGPKTIEVLGSLLGQPSAKQLESYSRACKRWKRHKTSVGA